MRVPETVFGATPASSVRVLIVVDTAADFRVAEAFAIASNEAWAEVSVALMNPRDVPNTGEQPRPIAEAMRSADVSSTAPPL